MRTLLFVFLLFTTAVQAQWAYLRAGDELLAAPADLVRVTEPAPLAGGVRAADAASLPWAEAPAPVFLVPEEASFTWDLSHTFYRVRPTPHPASTVLALELPRPRHRGHGLLRDPEHPPKVVVAVDRVLRVIADAQLAAAEE